jgi:DNA-binding IclR family transcriptional regulator
MQQPERAVNVVAKAVQVLKACHRLGGGLSLGDIARHLDLPRSTVQRIVRTLVQESFLSTDGTASSIALGPELLAMGASVSANVMEKVHPLLKQIAVETGETVDLARFNRDHMVFINQVPGAHRLRAVSAVGDSFPLHCTANGKAVLAHLPEAMMQQYIRQPHYRFTANTLTKPGDLAREIEKIRSLGMAHDMEEHTVGICAVGAAVRDRANQLYAVSIPVPSARFKESRTRCELALAAAMPTLSAVLRE